MDHGGPGRGREAALKPRRHKPAFGLPGGRENRTAAHLRAEAFTAVLLSIPRGRVATYGQVAEAAGYPRHARHVANLLKSSAPGTFPWHRVVGAGGAVKTPGRYAAEQRLRLRAEGVTFTGPRVNLARHQHHFPTRWL